jgi:exopolysaccharide biosynthesis polyprenyl glycosylphosphotransferase
MNLWQRPSRARLVLRVLGDAAATAASGVAAFWLRIHLPLPFTAGLLPGNRLDLLERDGGAVLLLQFASLYFFGFYDRPRPRSRTERLRLLSGAMVLQGAALAGYFFFTFRPFPRSVLVLYFLLDLALLLAWRGIIDRGGRQRERSVAIVGCGQAAGEIARALAQYHWHGLRVAGFVPRPGQPPPADLAAVEPALGPLLGTAEDLPALLACGRIEDIVLADGGDSWQTRLIDSLAGTRPAHTNVLLLPGPFESLIGRMRYRWVHDLPLIEVVRETEWRINWPLKRMLDMAAGSLLLVAALPAVAACALVVRLTSPGPIFYRQERIGRDRRPFTLFKFRTMHNHAEAESGEVLAQPGDPRLTPCGALLRRFRLDEIPQLLNVLRGTMSLVGPRPERPGFVQRYLVEVPGYAERFSLAPGLTGLAQVNGEYHSSPQNKLRYDLAYAANWSLWLDVSILVRTVKIVLTSRGV